MSIYIYVNIVTAVNDLHEAKNSLKAHQQRPYAGSSNSSINSSNSSSNRSFQHQQQHRPNNSSSSNSSSSSTTSISNSSSILTAAKARSIIKNVNAHAITRGSDVENVIVTSRYSLLSFIPKSLLEQFRRLANVYFLVIGVIALIGNYTDVFQTSVLPEVWVKGMG